MNLNRLKKVANKSPHSKYCHSVLILKGDQVLSYGYNFNHAHAEEVAIRRLKRIEILPKNLHLISYMFNRKSNRVNNSYPCSNCMEAIKSTKEIATITYFKGGIPWQMKIV